MTRQRSFWFTAAPLQVLFGILLMSSLLSVATYAAPGEGSMTKATHVSGCRAQVTVRWNLSTFGGPFVNGTWKFTSSDLDCEAHYSTVIWLKVGPGYVEIDPVVPKVNGDWGFSVGSIPNWDDVICQPVRFQGRFTDETEYCYSEDQAKSVWRSNAPVTDFHVGWSEDGPSVSTGDDRAALETLYNATGGPSWNNNTNWLTAAPLGEWHGVTTDTAGRVTELDLHDNGLTGSIPAELGTLMHLEDLDLSDFEYIVGENSLGGPIPVELGNLVNLEELYLYGNELTGPVPVELGSLVNLEWLNLRSNALTGPIPRELGNLSSLEVLILSENRLTGTVPESLTQLALLRFWIHATDVCLPTDAAFQAWVATIGDFRGELCRGPSNQPPEPVGTLRPLTIGVYEASVTVEVSGAFRDPDGDRLTYRARSSSPSVASVAVSGSRVTVTPASEGTAAVTVTATDVGGSNTAATQTFAVTVRGVVPTDRVALEALYDATGGAGWTNSTNWKTSAPLGEWYGVTTDAGGRVTELDLKENGLAGPIPAALQDLVNLQLLYLWGNELTGPVPAWLGSMARLRRLNLGGNALTGPIPGALASLVNLEQLYLGGNALTGPVPAWLGNMTRLRWLSLGGNDFSSGPIPGALASLVNLEWLYLYDSNLTGPVPAWLGNLVQLEWLYLSSNSLSGGIPPELANLASLERLFLSGNQLTGPIPPGLAGLANLEFLGLQENGLTGRIPEWLGDLANLRSLTLGSSGLTGPIPRALSNLTNLETLYLWGLGLTGRIPAWLGSLRNLRSLSLSRNELTGAISTELGNLANLQRLWFYENPLSGTIPESLTRLSLGVLWIHDTGVCVPADAAFQAWVATIENFRGDICTGPANRPPEPVGTLAP